MQKRPPLISALIELLAIRLSPQAGKSLVMMLSLLSSAAIAAPVAPVAPDAGTTSRELQKQPVFTVAKPAPVPLKAADEAVSPTAAEGERIDVKTIRVTGSQLFSATELEALVAHWIGTGHTLPELNQAAARITEHYRQRGYLLARAYLPAQDIKDGILTINVMEGLVGKINLSNKSRVSDKAGNGLLSKVKSGIALQAKQIDRAVLLLNDTPGVGGSRASLQPGASVGTTDLLIELDPTKAFSANVELDNYGNRYTGVNRIGAALAFNSPLKIGDQFTLRALTSNGGMSYARLAYQLPIGNDGLKLGAAYSDTRYKLGNEFASLSAHGTAGSSSLYATYPIIRSQETNLSSTLTYERKKLADYTDIPASTTDKNVQLINAGIAGSQQDTRLSGGMSSFDLSLVSGKLGMDATAQATDIATAQTDGAYTKLGYNLSRLQRLTDKDTLSLAFSGQQANKNLNSSEKFSLGGANGVRAYPQGEGSGDLGWMLNAEVRHTLKDNLQAIAFYDTGSVTINRTPYSTSINNRDIAGAGVGVNAQYKMVQLKTFVAWRNGAGGQPQGEPATMNRNPRLWVQVGGAF